MRAQQLHRARYMSFNQNTKKNNIKSIRIYIYGQFFTHPNVQKRKIDTYPFSHITTKSISSTV